jgi:hypothetical protein
MSASYLALAQRFGLVTTGGSDFHGASKPDIQLGTGTGKLAVPKGVLLNLKGAAHRSGQL